MSRSVSAVLSLALLAVLVPSAVGAASSTPTRVGVDEDAQVSFSMTGREITVTLRPVDGAENPIVRDLSGTDVVVACSGSSPKNKKRRGLIAEADLVWADGATQQTVRLSKDVSYKPKWCVLERPQGSDLAVTFKLRVVKTEGSAGNPSPESSTGAKPPKT
ncbi:MAG: hypothetical protein JHD16_04930 [Solirubrobacteraceae bacterium]|nr:hypothetical protein [Solirubrobacteraceae bacterium]